MARALTAVDVQDLASHETRRLEIQNRSDDVGDLSHAAQRLQGAQPAVPIGRVHWGLDDTQRNRIPAIGTARAPSRLRASMPPINARCR